MTGRPGLIVLNASADTHRRMSGVLAAEVDRDTGADEDAVRVLITADLNPTALAAVGSLLYAIKQGREVLVVTDDDFVPAVVQLAAHQSSPQVAGSEAVTSDAPATILGSAADGPQAVGEAGASLRGDAPAPRGRPANCERSARMLARADLIAQHAAAEREDRPEDAWNFRVAIAIADLSELTDAVAGLASGALTFFSGMDENVPQGIDLASGDVAGLRLSLELLASLLERTGIGHDAAPSIGDSGAGTPGVGELIVGAAPDVSSFGTPGAPPTSGGAA